MKNKIIPVVLTLSLSLSVFAVPGIEKTVNAEAAENALPSKYNTSLTDTSAGQTLYMFPDTRDQGDNGLCWAYAAAGLAELNQVVQEDVDNTVDYSELALAYNTYYTAFDPLGGTKGDLVHITGGSSADDYIDIGGDTEFALYTLAKWDGVMDEDLYPYSRENAISLYNEGISDSAAYSNDSAHLEDGFMVDPVTDLTSVKQLVKDYGGVAISFDMDQNDKYYNSETDAYHNYRSDNGATHQAVIVGWDDSFSASNFPSSSSSSSKIKKNGAWLLRNCWSTTTGMSLDSYFWLSYYEPGIEDKAYSFNMGNADNYDHNYQYDGGIATYTDTDTLTKNSLDFSKTANIYTNSSDNVQLLKAVAINPDNAGAKYKIQIYTNLTSRKNPVSGRLAYTKSGTCTYAGFQTIDLGEAVGLSPDERFSVVVTFSNDQMGVEYGTDKVFDDGTEPDAELIVDCPDYSSMVYSKADGKWKNMATYSSSLLKKAGITLGNFRIKAYTDDASDKEITEFENKAANSMSSLKVSNIGLTGTSTRTTITLSWKSVYEADGYYIYKKNNDTGKYKLVKQIKNNRTVSYKFKKLKKHTTYSYAVCAYRKFNGQTYKSSTLAKEFTTYK